MTEQTNIDIDSLLDADLDQLADLPEFKVFNPGTHRVTIKWEKKAINKHPAVEAKFTLLETLELVDTSQTPDEVGTESSVAFMMDNEFGQGNLKKLITPIGEAIGVGKVSEIIKQSEGMEVVITTKQRPNKDKTAVYLDVVSLVVA